MSTDSTGAKAAPFAVHNTCATAAECRRAQAAYLAMVDDPAAFPCSFSLDGAEQHGFAGFVLEGHDVDTLPDKRTDTLRLRRPEGLAVRAVCTLYPRYAAYEWTLYFENTAAGPSARISKLAAADILLPGRGARLSGILGDARNETYGAGDGTISPTYGMNNQPYDLPLAMGLPQQLRNVGGCGSNHEFPYFIVDAGEGGAIVAVGWPGQWQATLFAGAQGVRLQAGQATLDAWLRPGETMRTPLMCFVWFDGHDADRKTNLWRHFFMDCNMPRCADGHIPAPVLGSGHYKLMDNTNEAEQIAQIRGMREKGFAIDNWWMDAGWYTVSADGEAPKVEDDYVFTGTWQARAEDFPTGMRAVSDCMALTGGDTLLWFEPERCSLSMGQLREDGTTPKPEWLLKGYQELVRPREGGDKLLPIRFIDLGNPEAYAWLRDRIVEVMEKGGIGWYREDHNIRPLEFWQQTDEPGRAGLTENHYITAHLRLWDELAARFGVLDSCASGGRRNDLESMRRAVPLHITDFFINDLPRRQAVHQALFRWFPYFKANADASASEGEALGYALRSAMVPWYLISAKTLQANEAQLAAAHEVVEEWRAVNRYFYADYYPLLEWNIDEGSWLAWEFIDSEAGEGFVQAYRRPLCEQDTVDIPLKGLDAARQYSVKVLHTGETTVSSGAVLMSAGVRLRLEAAPAAATLLIGPA